MFRMSRIKNISVSCVVVSPVLSGGDPVLQRAMASAERGPAKYTSLLYERKQGVVAVLFSQGRVRAYTPAHTVVDGSVLRKLFRTTNAHAAQAGENTNTTRPLGQMLQIHVTRTPLNRHFVRLVEGCPFSSTYTTLNADYVPWA